MGVSCCGKKKGPGQLGHDQRVQPVQTPYIVGLTELEEYLKPQYFILPIEYQQFAENYERTVKNQLGNLTVFRNRQELQAYKQDDKNNILIICCKNLEEVKDVSQLANFHTFSKLAIAINFHINSIGEENKNLQLSLGFRFKEIIKYTTEDMLSFFTSAKEEKNMFFCHTDIGMINRTFLTFNYMLGAQDPSSLSRFQAWLRLKNGQGLADEIKSTGSSTRIAKTLIQNLFSQNQIAHDANRILRTTRNPGILAHFTWLYSTIFNFIRKEYKTYKTNPDNIKRLPQQFIVWLKLTKEEVQILKDSKGENAIFSGFLLGYTEDHSNLPNFSNDPNCYKFYINIRKDIKDYLEKVDLGFYIDQNRVIFNLLNLFSVDNIDITSKEVHLTYSSIGFEYNLRQTEFRYSKDATKGNLRMMKLYDYFCLNKCYIKNQVDLLFSLQMYEKYKEIVIMDVARYTKLSSETVRSSLASTISTLDTKLLSSIHLNETLGDAEFMTKNIERSVEHYRFSRSEDPLRGYVKKLDFYHRTSNGPKFRETVEQYRNNTDLDRSKSSKFVQLALDNFIAIMASRSGQYKNAYRMIHKTLNDISKLLEDLRVMNQQKKKAPPQLTNLQLENFHAQSYRSFPLYYMLLKTSVIIARAHGEIPESIISERECEDIRPIFDGIHMIWLQ